MRGHITQRSKCSFSVVIDVDKDPLTKKRKQKWYTVDGSKKDAERFLTEKLRELDTGTFIDCNLTTLGDYLNHWLEVCCKPNQTPNTYESYERNVTKHIIPGIGNIKLNSLTPLQLQGFYTKCLKEGRLNNKGGLSGKTVLYLHRILHSALGQAVKWQLIIRNVGDLVDPPKPKKFKPRVFESDQVKQLIAAAEISDIHIPVLVGRRHPSRDASPRCHRTCSFPASGGPNTIP